MPLFNGALIHLPDARRLPVLIEPLVTPSQTRAELYSGLLDGSFVAEIAPTSNNWEVSSILLQMRTRGAVGARAIVATITPSTGSTYLLIPLTIGISSADASTRIVAIGGPGYQASRFVGSGGGFSFEAITFPTPKPLYMNTGYKVEVLDVNGVDNTDSVDMTIMYKEVTEWR